MVIRNKCDYCKKPKWFAHKRIYWVERIKEYITTEGKVCGKCSKKLAAIVKKT